jgi:SAM-dependent methyltransferase
VQVPHSSTSNLRIDHRFDRFWESFSPHFPTFEGKSVLEIGCGEGSRCLEAADRGAHRVVGVDPFAPSISVARAQMATVPLAQRERIAFFEGTLPMLPPEKFDLIISEDTLEHVLDVPELLAEIKSRLHPGGQFYLGFGPLYHSFDGDHGWMRAVLPGRELFPWPWGHLFLEKRIFRSLSTIYGKPILDTQNWPYLSLNRHTSDEYLKMFTQSGLRMVFLRVNHVTSLKGKLFAAIRRIPGLARYFTLNMYAIFEKA